MNKIFRSTLFRALLISLTIFYSSLLRGFTSFVRFIVRDDIVNGIFLKTLFCLLLVNRIPKDFWLLALYPALLPAFIDSNNYL